MTKRRVVGVWWEDSFSHDAWTRDIGEFIKGSCNVVTVGLEMANDENGIVVAVSVNDSGQKAGIWKIPRGMVREIRVLADLELSEGE